MKKLQNDHSAKDTQRDYCSRQGQSAGCINIIEFLVMFTTDHSDAWSLARENIQFIHMCSHGESLQSAQTLDIGCLCIQLELLPPL